MRFCVCECPCVCECFAEGAPEKAAAVDEEGEEINCLLESGFKGKGHTFFTKLRFTMPQVRELHSIAICCIVGPTELKEVRNLSSLAQDEM